MRSRIFKDKDISSLAAQTEVFPIYYLLLDFSPAFLFSPARSVALVRDALEP